jgi:molybdenum cofactor cytidylyltransferase
MTFAVVPACGHSTRMGRPKLALSLGDRTVIEHVVAALREGGVECVLVVVGPHVPELIPLASAAGANVLAVPNPTPDMRTTVECGLAWIKDHQQPDAADCWLLAPADHPAFSSAIVRQLLNATSNSSRSIIVPVCEGQRGHPALLRWHHAAGIRSLAAGEGINAYLRLHANETLELPVADSGILSNLDTVDDYARLRDTHL